MSAATVVLATALAEVLATVLPGEVSDALRDALPSLVDAVLEPIIAESKEIKRQVQWLSTKAEQQENQDRRNNNNNKNNNMSPCPIRVGFGGLVWDFCVSPSGKHRGCSY